MLRRLSYCCEMFSYALIIFLVCSLACLDPGSAGSLRAEHFAQKTGQVISYDSQSQGHAKDHASIYQERKDIKRLSVETETDHTIIRTQTQLESVQESPKIAKKEEGKTLIRFGNSSRIRRSALTGAKEISSYNYLRSRRYFWHVGIYSKSYTPYKQICGGTLVTLKAVISAAHCFWSELDGALPAEQFAVAAGHIYRAWKHEGNVFSQQSDVSAIHIPVRYRGAAANFQADIAVVVLADQIEDSLVVSPACVSFEERLDSKQIVNGSLGTVLGWGLTDAEGPPSKKINFLEMPSVDVKDCMDEADPSFLQYITADKICTGVTTGKALCRGDSGGGWVVFAGDAPYLRGVASTAPRDGHACNTHARAAVTHTLAHRAFLLRHVPYLEKVCGRHYRLPELEDRVGGTLKCNKCEL